MKRLFILFLACFLLTQTAFAAEAGPYKDVPVLAANVTEISYVADAGYMSGYGDGSFRPDGLVTLKQVAFVLARSALKDGVLDPVGYLINQGYVTSGIDAASASDCLVSPALGMTILGRAYGVLPIQSASSEHLAYNADNAARFMQNAGIELSIFDWRINTVMSHEYMTRSDLAYVLCRLEWYRVSRPDVQGYGWNYIPVTYTPAFEYLYEDLWDDILVLPWSIVKHYHDAGYQVVLDNEYIMNWFGDDYWESDNPNASVVAVFSSANRTIFIRDVNALVHEIGHYAERFMLGSTEAEAAFPREKDNAVENISKYAGSSAGEFFAECFDYYIRAKNGGNYAELAMMSERLPETYAYLCNMDVLNWHSANHYVAPDVVRSGVFPQGYAD